MGTPKFFKRIEVLSCNLIKDQFEKGNLDTNNEQQ